MNNFFALARWIGALTVAAVLLPAVYAQDTAVSNDTTAEAVKSEFDRQFAAYRETARRIEQLRIDYQSADAATRLQINEQLRDESSAAKEQLDAMMAAASDVYRLDPNADPQITEMLLAVARFYAVGETPSRGDPNVHGGDNYEQALPILQLLIEGGAAQPQLPAWGFLAAFATNDHQLAESLLERASEAGALVDPRSIEDAAAKEVMSKVLQFSGAVGPYRDLWAQEQAIRTAEAAADDLPRVKLSTSKGDIVLELFENEAPQAVASFITLVKSGFYDGVAFHRVLHCFMAQGGDPKGDGTGGPGYSIRCECYQPNFRRHFRGSLSMAHAGRDTGGSQFFLTFLPAGQLDGKHTVFGRVIEGIEVLGDLQKRDPQGSAPPTPDRILKAEVLRDRGHDYVFEKLPAR